MTYSFVNLTPAQLEERRRQLNLAGFQAWLTPIILLVTICLYRRLLKSAISMSAKSTSLNSLQILVRRTSWFLHTTYLPEFGPLHIQLSSLLYFSWLLYLIFRATGNDYMHLTKSFGHVAVSQLPIHYLLSTKSTYSPITLATGLTHERLNAYHRLFGRMIHVLLVAHAILYIRFFMQMNVLEKRLGDRDVRLGIAAFWTLNFLGILSLPSIRRKIYHKVFYRSHALLSILFLPIVFFHVPYTRFYVVQAGVIWFLSGFMRMKTSAKAQARCEKIHGTKLVSVRFDADKKSNLGLAHAAPGQHVYVHRTGKDPKTPFTIASLRPADTDVVGGLQVQLVARNTGGPQTSWLEAMATNESQIELLIEGPYGEASNYMPSLLEAVDQPVLLIAGGVGATYTLPIYSALVSSRRGGATAIGKGKGKIKMVWMVRTPADAAWGIEILNYLHDVDLDVDVYITTPSTDMDIHADTKGPSKKEEDEGIRIHRLGRRPKLMPLIDNFFSSISSPPSSSAAVLLCGPSSLSRDAHKAVGNHVLKSQGTRVEWFEEVFGFGGS
ncbi:uncharacterized protein Z518_01019 [Rhinocladiella mackenziei CBS 650.93]|uniref:FAD-binding FR-type domain-containing protein n=1 Tax=Rhinocladiella mackenziei CBS 650.93 TaxID=1442369 RepID=A0A0D2HGZ5_9EURO|nr:uncharacterized protein Z518_01019 [Rhinocladiella mackenziei CBS 650.93]KIX09938.1 hypothetical protein Z518_01019 [Rhinocladiella mackenziei CBS 650.93]